MAVKKTVRSKTAPSPHPQAKPARSTRATRPGGDGSFGPGAVVLVAICAIGIAMLIAARGSSAPQAAAAADAVTQPSAPAESPVPSKKPAAANRATTTPAPPQEAPPAPAAATLSSAVTILGCVDRADGGFRLKNTSGEDAPKARSWKTGFLKKGSPPIAIVATASGLRLSDYEGHRVSATGALIDREMRVHSLRRISTSCD